MNDNTIFNRFTFGIRVRWFRVLSCDGLSWRDGDIHPAQERFRWIRDAVY